jgi:hypothetical protein
MRDWSYMLRLPQNDLNFTLYITFRHLADILTLIYDIYMFTSRLTEKGGSYMVERIISERKIVIVGNLGGLPHTHSVISDIYVPFDSLLVRKTCSEQENPRAQGPRGHLDSACKNSGYGKPNSYKLHIARGHFRALDKILKRNRTKIVIIVHLI